METAVRLSVLEKRMEAVLRETVDMRADMRAVRTELGGLRTELGGVRADLRSDSRRIGGFILKLGGLTLSLMLGLAGLIAKSAHWF